MESAKSLAHASELLLKKIKCVCVCVWEAPGLTTAKQKLQITTSQQRSNERQAENRNQLI